MAISIDTAVATGVQATIAAYARALDAGKPADIAELFCPDGIAEIAGSRTFEGRDAIRAGYAAWAPTRPQLHLVTNTVITSWTADSATAISDVAFLQRREAGWAVQLVGRYDDTLHLADGIWRFHHRVTTLQP